MFDKSSVFKEMKGLRVFIQVKAEAYLESKQTSKMKLFV